jgi:hypothetical protein
MNKPILCLFLTVLTVFLGAITVNALGPHEVVTGYFQALQQGDIETIKNLIAGKLYNKREIVLEQNESYAKFLKRYYKKSNFEIKKIIIDKNNAQANVEVNFSNGNAQFIVFLNKDSQGNWKIVGEVSD